MEFGYFTLSDNNYDDISRTPEEFILEIREQALHAEKLHMYSAWIGEHHFDSLGVNSCPHMVLASIVAQTKHIRLAPAVAVIPMHHPLRVAEEWATLDLLSGGRVDFAVGRGYDRKEYEPFGADYMTSLERMEEGIDIIKKAWETNGKWSHHGRFYTIENMAITPRPLQKHVPFFMACFSKASMEIAGRRGMDIIFAPFAAALTFGDLGSAVRAYREECEKNGNKPGKAMCSYFIHIGEGKDEQYGRERQMAYFRRAVKPALTQDPTKSPPSMRYMDKIVEILENMKGEDLGEKSILLGSPQKIVDSLKRVEAAGIEEVILYFNVGGKPHDMVLDQMNRFMSEIAPHFAGSHTKLKARAAE
jgi:alkanesulfonate monooxygenase SsuD/methylene tetrahydromethanopterin reductase-like flavin-dependent oxidoreductase (luciferase family)